MMLCSCGAWRKISQILVIQQLFLGMEQQQFCCWSISMTRKRRRMKENAFLSEPKHDIYDVCTSGASWCSRQNPPQHSALIRRASLMTQSVKKRPALGFKGRFVGSVSTRCGVLSKCICSSSRWLIFTVPVHRFHFLSVVSNGSSPTKQMCSKPEWGKSSITGCWAFTQKKQHFTAAQCLFKTLFFQQAQM